VPGVYVFQSAPRSEDRGDSGQDLSGLDLRVFQSAPRTEDRGDCRAYELPHHHDVSIRAPIRGPGRPR